MANWTQGARSGKPRSLSEDLSIATARWVAYYRALESERPDALFKDPFARELAGDSGYRMATLDSPSRPIGWAVSVRTALIDGLVADAATQWGCDVVFVLGAGLDTRPYRMTLPSALRWVEVDLPQVIAFKEDRLAHATPACTVERVGLDLADCDARRHLCARIAAQTRRGLIVSEGLLVYLSEDQVRALGSDLYEQPVFSYWLIDQASPSIVEYMKGDYRRALALANAQMLFAPVGGLEFHRAQGWRPREVHDIFEEGRRLDREMHMAWLGRLLGLLHPQHPTHWSVVALLERVEPACSN